MMRVAVFAVLATVAILASFATRQASAVIGGDISEPFPTSAFYCAHTSGWDFIIVRGFMGTGSIDPNAVDSLERARTAGIPYRDTYCVPNTNQAPSYSVGQITSHLGGKFAMIWLNVETGTWGSDHAANCNWISSWLDAARSAGVHAGVYASEHMWSSIVGSGCTTGADHGAPLWYASYDGLANFNDFRPFGGWRSPTMKQYTDCINVPCTMTANANWYP
jgi:hypothetical protein